MAVMTDELGIRRGHALRAAVERGLVDEQEPVVGLLDVTGIQQTATALHAAFATPGVSVTHTFAVKAASLVPVLALLGECGLGAEVASPGELALAHAAGIPAARTVLDSPAKTTAELREALALGIAVNSPGSTPCAPRPPPTHPSDCGSTRRSAPAASAR
jgi:diaminopimelate decarboxylase